MANQSVSKNTVIDKNQPANDKPIAYITPTLAHRRIQRVADRLEVVLGEYFSEDRFSILTHFNEYSGDMRHQEMEDIYIILDLAQRELDETYRRVEPFEAVKNISTFPESEKTIWDGPDIGYELQWADTLFPIKIFIKLLHCPC